MMTFKEACEAVDYDITEVCPITANYVFYAYLCGKSEEFPTKAEALKFSSNIERVETTKEQREAWFTERVALESKAAAIWYGAMKTDFLCYSIYKNVLTEAMFEVCYAEAYERGHSAGYDEVGNYMYSVVDFAIKIKNCK